MLLVETEEGAAVGKSQPKNAAAKRKPAKKPAKAAAKRSTSKAVQSDDEMEDAEIEVLSQSNTNKRSCHRHSVCGVLP